MVYPGVKGERLVVKQIASGDKVLLEFSTFGDRFLSVVTDVREDGRLLVYSPVPDAVLERLKSDPTVFVRFAHEGVLLGYASRVLNEVVSSNTILELHSPREVLDAEDRKEPRCVCHFPAIVANDLNAAQGVIEDMSASCSRVRFLNGGVELAPGENVKLTFHPFDMSEGYAVACTVLNVFMKDGGQYAVLEFDKDEVDARKRIAEFIEAQVCCGIPRL